MAEAKHGELEFTGERVVPGAVDADLWNEHYARYLFAARFARGERVVDLGCGTGYGAALLAETAAAVTGIDVSAAAVDYARAHYGRANLTFREASCTATGLPDASFDLITAFEIIEHLEDWQKLLQEARRLLAADGQFLVSTPNKDYYGEAREQAGANPYHVHEFEFAEFESALRTVFPFVSLFTQNHSDVTLFQPCTPSGAAELRIEADRADTATAHFYFAICALTPQTGASAFAYIPRAANMLRERERHIVHLESQVRQLGARVVELQDEVAASNLWSQGLNREIDEARRRIAQVQDELAAHQAAAQKAIDDLQARYDSDLSEANRLLNEANQTVVERTEWALSLETRMATIRNSRWYRLGRKFGLRLNLKPSDEMGGPPPHS